MTNSEIKRNDLIFPELSYKLIGAAFKVFNKIVVELKVRPLVNWLF